MDIRFFIISLGLGIDADFLIYFTLIMICKHSQLLSSCSAEADIPENRHKVKKRSKNNIGIVHNKIQIN